MPARLQSFAPALCVSHRRSTDPVRQWRGFHSRIRPSSVRSSIPAEDRLRSLVLREQAQGRPRIRTGSRRPDAASMQLLRVDFFPKSSAFFGCRPLQLDAVHPAAFVVPARRRRPGGTGSGRASRSGRCRRVGPHFMLIGRKFLSPAHQEVVAPAGGVGAAVRLQDVLLDAAPVDAAEDHAVAVLLRHVRRVERDQPGVRPAALLVERVVANLVDVAVGVGVVARPGLPLVDAARARCGTGAG